MKFKKGDRVVLAHPYWVFQKDDCINALSIQGFVVGETWGTIHSPEEDVLESQHGQVFWVEWDQGRDQGRLLRINQACLELIAPEPTEDDVAAAIESIMQSRNGGQ